jgi:hypothetical protein
MLTNTRKPEIRSGRKKFDAKPTAPAIEPITNPTRGQRKKYLDITSIDSIPTGTIVKKPNKPFKPLSTNQSTFNGNIFCPEEHMCHTWSFKFAQKFTHKKTYLVTILSTKSLYEGLSIKTTPTIGEKEGIYNVLVKIHDGKRTAST